MRRGFASFGLVPAVAPIAAADDDGTPLRTPDPSAGAVPRAPAPKLEWLVSWGVRYQAFAWGWIELAVRHRQAEGLAASTVFVRVNGVWER